MKRNTNWTPTFLPVLTTCTAHGNTCVQSMQIQLSGSVLGIGIVRYICKAIISKVCRFELQQYIWDSLKRLRHSRTRVPPYNLWSRWFETFCSLPTTFLQNLPTQYRCAVLPTWTLRRRSRKTALLYCWYWKIYLFFIYFYIHPIDNLQLF